MSGDDLVGEELCGYRLTSRLGEGGMAVVYRGENTFNPRIVRALKVVHADLSRQPSFRSRVLEETAILEALTHPNIVRFHEVRHESGQLVIILELLTGRTLDAVTSRVSVTDAVSWMSQASAGTGFAHSQGMVHRDLKPANLYLTTDGVVKVLDFGIARALDDANRLSGATRTGMVPGTPAYMAPEVCSGEKPGAHADVYALGLCLWGLLAGYHPFAAPGAGRLTDMQMMFAQVKREIPDIRTVRPDVPEFLAVVIAKAVSKDPQLRFPNAVALSDALQAPTDSIPSTPSFPTQGFETHLEIPKFEPASRPEDLNSPGVSGDGAIPAGDRTGRSASLHPGSSSEDTVSPLRKRVWGCGLVAIVGAVFLGGGGALLFNYLFGDVDYPMVQISAGTFMMGSNDLESDEMPIHTVRLTYDFSLGATEVTQGLWQDVMGSNPSDFSSCGRDCPVETISWYDAVRFANALSDREGLERCYFISGETVRWPKGLDCKGYRLPTESEWEYAARAGESARYAGSNDVNAVAWTDGNSGGRAHPVGQKRANAWGLYDMSGNMWEWCWDWFGDYPSGTRVDPLGSDIGPFVGSHRVIRGGSWSYVPVDARVANRGKGSPSSAFHALGFRLARSL